MFVLYYIYSMYFFLFCDVKLQKEFSPDSLQIFCSLEGIGVSVINHIPNEVAYCTITRYMYDQFTFEL